MLRKFQTLSIDSSLRITAWQIKTSSIEVDIIKSVRIKFDPFGFLTLLNCQTLQGCRLKLHWTLETFIGGLKNASCISELLDRILKKGQFYQRHFFYHESLQWYICGQNLVQSWKCKNIQDQSLHAFQYWTLLNSWMPDMKNGNFRLWILK